MNTVKVYKVVGADEFGQTFPISKKSHATPPQAASWAKENVNLDRHGYLIVGVNVAAPEEEAKSKNEGASAS